MASMLQSSSSILVSGSSLVQQRRTPFRPAQASTWRSRTAVSCSAARQDLSAEPFGLSIQRRAVLASLLVLPFAAPQLASAATGTSGKVFVAGATGATGSRVVKQLSRAGYQVLAGTRDEKKAQKLFGGDANITPVKFNLFDSDSIASAIGDAAAVISCLGYSGFNPSGYKDVDLTGTVKLIEGAQKAGAKKFVLLTSLLTNAKAAGQESNNNYRFLNAFGGVLDNKLEAEKVLRASGLDYTIVRPGGLSNEAPENIGNLYVSKEDTLFGLDGDPGRSISRDDVAAVIVEALSQGKAANKVVEIVAGKNLPKLSTDKWFDV